MKTILLILTALSLTSCSHFPKDSYIKDAEVNTPWGSTKIGLAATGKAAANLTVEERKAMLTPTQK